MPEIFLVAALGLVFGGVIAWFWASARVRACLGLRIFELEARAREAEVIRDELRQQLGSKDEETSKLRLALTEEQKSRIEFQTRLEAAQQNFNEQKELLEKAKSTFKDAFGALTADALKNNNQSFLELAKECLRAIVNETKGDIGKRQEAIDGLINPLREALQRYEAQIKAMETK